MPQSVAKRQRPEQGREADVVADAEADRRQRRLRLEIAFDTDEPTVPEHGDAGQINRSAAAFSDYLQRQARGWSDGSSRPPSGAAPSE